MAIEQERYHDAIEAVRIAQDGHQAQIWTAMPGIIQSYNSAHQTVTVQVATKVRVTQPSGAVVHQALPLLVDVPVQFPAGAGHSMTFPIAAGDECLVHFASRCIDNWWANGGVQPQAELRMHDLSDGFAALGYRSRPRAIGAVSTSSLQLRSDDGQTLVDVNGATRVVTMNAAGTVIKVDGTQQVIGMSAANGVTIVTPELTVTGQIIAGFGTADQVSLTTHTHAHGPHPDPGS